LGCFQINWRWHGQHFDRPEALLDPLVSARYAARFLAGLYAETGDWTLAAGAYHSRTPHLAQRYRDRFARLRAALADDAGAPATARQPVAPHRAPTTAETSRPRMARPIRYALLSPGAPAPEGASLVPQGAPAPHRAGHHPATPAGGGGIATPAATGTAFLPGLPAAQDITP
ncbi:MAG: hypothetical protein JJU19_07810, partial [Pararhodobacter sp.]|nr:hypothetical protein [Pararhodobacter sp.]